MQSQVDANGISNLYETFTFCRSCKKFQLEHRPVDSRQRKNTHGCCFWNKEAKQFKSNRQTPPAPQMNFLSNPPNNTSNMLSTPTIITSGRARTSKHDGLTITPTIAQPTTATKLDALPSPTLTLSPVVSEAPTPLSTPLITLPAHAAPTVLASQPVSTSPSSPSSTVATQHQLQLEDEKIWWCVHCRYVHITSYHIHIHISHVCSAMMSSFRNGCRLLQLLQTFKL
jgi:hypothetical protein